MILVSIDLTSSVSPIAVMFVTGSITTACRLELADEFVNADQVASRPAMVRPHRVHLQQALPDVPVEVEADRGHVADDLGGRLSNEK